MRSSFCISLSNTVTYFRCCSSLSQQFPAASVCHANSPAVLPCRPRRRLGNAFAPRPRRLRCRGSSFSHRSSPLVSQAAPAVTGEVRLQGSAGPSVAVSGSQTPAPAAGSPRAGRRRRAKPRFVPSVASLCPCSLPLPWCGRPPWPLHRGAHSASACPRLRSALFFSQHRMYMGPLVFLTNSSVLGVD